MSDELIGWALVLAAGVYLFVFCSCKPFAKGWKRSQVDRRREEENARRMRSRE